MHSSPAQTSTYPHAHTCSLSHTHNLAINLHKLVEKRLHWKTARAPGIHACLNTSTTRTMHASSRAHSHPDKLYFSTLSLSIWHPNVTNNDHTSKTSLKDDKCESKLKTLIMQPSTKRQHAQVHNIGATVLWTRHLCIHHLPVTACTYTSRL